MEETMKTVYIQGQAVPVTGEVYDAYYQPIWRTFNFARMHGQCSIPDWHGCEGDCGICRYKTAGDEFSLNELAEANAHELINTDTDPACIVEGMIVMEDILDAIEEIDPDGRKIAMLMTAGETDSSIARTLKIPGSTFYKRKMRIRRELKKIISNFL